MSHSSCRDPQLDRQNVLPPPFGCTRTIDDQHAATVSVTGELDIATTPELTEALGASLLHPRLVVVDLRELAFIDSGGVRAVVQVSARARDAGQRVVVLLGSATIKGVFTLAGSQGHVEQVDVGSLRPSVQALLRPR